MRNYFYNQSSEQSFYYFLPLLLTLSVLLITFIVGVESYLQYNFPEKCLLSLAHRYNLLTEYEVTYEPNRGIWHIIGWTGTFLMVLMHVYTLRKKVGFMHEWGMLKYWLDFHILCGIMGPVLVTFHTTFKLGGIVSISYWSVVIVALSGLFGRFIFGLIPRGIAGKELNMEEIERLNELVNHKITLFYRKAKNLREILDENLSIAKWEDEKIIQSFLNMIKDEYKSYFKIRKINRIIKKRLRIYKRDRLQLIKILREKLRLNREVQFLRSTHRLFGYWHIFHIIFTITLYLIALVHIIIYYIFRVNV